MSIKVNPEWWKTLFDQIYLLTDARSVCNATLTNLEVDFFCRLLGLDTGDRIVDLCGGHGRHSLALCARGFSGCVLVDYSPALLASASKAAAEGRYPLACIRSDARSTGLASNCFDYVLILGNSLGYIQRNEADRQIMAEACRILRPGGRLLLDLSNGPSVKTHFAGNAWHEIGEDIIVCRHRELEKNTIRVREVVVSKQSGLVRDEAYAIHLYEPEVIEALMREARFEEVEVITDFRLLFSKEDCGCMDHRMIVLGRKPGKDFP